MSDFLIFIWFLNVIVVFPIMLIIFLSKRSKVISWYGKTNERQKVVIRILSVLVPVLFPFLLYLEYTRK